MAWLGVRFAHLQLNKYEGSKFYSTTSIPTQGLIRCFRSDCSIISKRMVEKDGALALLKDNTTAFDAAQRGVASKGTGGWFR